MYDIYCANTFCESQPFYLSLLSQETHGSDGDKTESVEDDVGKEECHTLRDEKPGPEVCFMDRTVQTPAGTERGMDPGHSRVTSVISDGAGCSKPKDSEKEQMCKLHSGFAHRCVYPLELNTYLWDPSVSGHLFHSAQVNAWNSCATTDRAAQCTLNLATPVRTSGTPGFLQQQALLQVTQD